MKLGKPGMVPQMGIPSKRIYHFPSLTSVNPQMMGNPHGMSLVGHYPPGTIPKTPVDLLGNPPFEKPNIIQVLL